MGRGCGERSRWWRWPGTVLLGAACSGGSHSSAASSSPAEQTAKAMNVFAQCMRRHGQVNFYYANPQSVANSSSVAFSLGQGYFVTGVTAHRLSSSRPWRRASACCRPRLTAP